MVSTLKKSAATQTRDGLWAGCDVACERHHAYFSISGRLQGSHHDRIDAIPEDA
jgi:hypothetical protein